VSYVSSFHVELGRFSSGVKGFGTRLGFAQALLKFDEIPYARGSAIQLALR